MKSRGQKESNSRAYIKSSVQTAGILSWQYLFGARNYDKAVIGYYNNIFIYNTNSANYIIFTDLS